MPTFLLRDSNNQKGYIEHVSAEGELPRSSALSYVPWGLTIDKQVVYAKTGEHKSWNGGRGQYRLTRYDSNVSQNRRKQCQTELGDFALSVPRFTNTAVRKVSLGIKNYLSTQLFSDQEKARNTLYKEIGHYFYTGGGKGFGRIDITDKKNMTPVQVWQGIMEVLEGGRLDQMLAVHDAVGRKLLPKMGGKQTHVYNRWKPILRQDWFDDRYKRGRAKANGVVAPTTVGGIVDLSQHAVVNPAAIERFRGVDMFERDYERTRDPRSDSYYDNVDARNLLFWCRNFRDYGYIITSGLRLRKYQSRTGA